MWNEHHGVLLPRTNSSKMHQNLTFSMASLGQGAGGKAAKDVRQSYRLRAGMLLVSQERAWVFLWP